MGNLRAELAEPARQLGWLATELRKYAAALTG